MLSSESRSRNSSKKNPLRCCPKPTTSNQPIMRTGHDSENPEASPHSSALKLLTLALMAGAVFATETASAQLVNVNFDAGVTQTEGSLVGPAGGMATSWNQYAGADSTGTVLDSNGAATSIGIDTNFTLTAVDPVSVPLTMLRGSMTDFGKGADNRNVTFSGLDAGELYDVWLVSIRSQPIQPANPVPATERYVGWWSTANTTASASDQLVDARGEPLNNSTFVAGYNYALFEDVVADGSGEITFTGTAGPLLDGSNNDYRFGINGLQIQRTAPPVAGPVDDAMSTVEASPTAVQANGISKSTVTVTLRDANGIRIPNKEVTLANMGGPQDATIDPSTALTTGATGAVNFSVSSNTVGTVVFTATVVTDSLTLTDTASVEFTDSGAPLAFNVNFHAGTNATGLVGVVGDPGETWNQGTTTASNLVDTTGTVTSPVNVSGLASSGSTTNAGLNIFDANRNFFGKGADTTISITNLEPGTAYDLYLYALSHNAASWGDITSTERAAGDFATTNSVVGNAQLQFLDNAMPGTNGSTFVANGNYVVFESIISDGSGNLSVLVDAYEGPGGDTRLHVNGLQIRPASGMSVDYTTWRDTYYPGLGLPGEDDDTDGLSNDYERIFGLDPTDPASIGPYWSAFDPDTGSLGYTRRSQSLANLNYKVWYSTDLENWFEDNAAVQNLESATDEVEFMGVAIDPLLLSERRLFVRVAATAVSGVDLEPSLVNLWGSGSTITILYSEPMNPSAATNPANYTVAQDGGGKLNITGATLNSDGGSVTLTLGSPLGIDTGYTVDIDGVTSSTGQSLGTGVSRQFKTWDDDPNGIKVFIVAGQSNMVGFGSVEDGNNGAGTLGSLRYLAVNNGSFPEYDYASLLDNPGQPATSAFKNRSDVKVWWRDGGANLGGTVRKGDLGPPFKGSDPGKIGPEYAFGQVIGDHYASDDVLIVKTAWGGRDLAQRFRPPSAVTDRGGRVGEFFSAIIDQTRDVLTNLDTEFPEWSGQGYEIVGFGWHQGFNDRINTPFSAEYKDNLPDLISDLRDVFNKPNLPVVVGSTGMATGPAESPPYSGYSAVEKAQLWVADVAQPDNVLSTDTRPFWRDPADSPATSGQGFHWNWNAETLFLIGKSMGDDMVDLLTP